MNRITPVTTQMLAHEADRLIADNAMNAIAEIVHTQAAGLAGRCIAEPTVFDYERCERVVLSRLIVTLSLGTANADMSMQASQLDAEHAREFLGLPGIEDETERLAPIVVGR